MKLISRYKIGRDEEHNYTVDDGVRPVILPGTTGILDVVGSKEKTNSLMGWSKKQALLKVADILRSYSGKPITIDEKIIEFIRKSAWKRDKELFEKAGDIGDKVHEAIDNKIKGFNSVLDEKAQIGFNNFISWLDGSGIKITHGDTYVASLEWGFGGAMDALGEKDGQVILLDWKTSNALRDTYPLQAAAYAIAFEETYGIKVDRAIVVRFGKEIPEVEPREVMLENAKAAFISALRLHKRMKENNWK